MTDLTTKAGRAALRAICEAATPGAWKVFELIRDCYEVCREADYAKGGICQPSNPHNADFIAVARTAFPAALTLLDTMAEEVERLRAALEPFSLIAEHDIGDSESDRDKFVPFVSNYNRAPKLTVGDLRRARTALRSGSEGGE